MKLIDRNTLILAFGQLSIVACSGAPELEGGEVHHDESMLVQASPRGANAAGSSTSIEVNSAATPITFDGEVMTDERAAEIVEKAGFDFIGSAPCPAYSDDCAVFYVRSRKTAAHLYTYQVSSLPCAVVSSMPYKGPADVAHATRSASASARATNGSPTTGASGTEVATGVDLVEVDASPCFAGYRTIFRARQDGLIETTEYGYYVASLTLTYQRADGNRWMDLASLTTTHAELDDPASGGTHFIDRYQISDGQGVVLASDSTESIAHAGGDGSITDKELCDSDAALAESKFVQGVDMMHGLCEVLLPSIQAALDLEVFGLELKFEANQSICKNHQATGKSAGNTVRESVRNECYHRAREPFVIDRLDVIVNPIHAEEMTLDGEPLGECPPIHNVSGTASTNDPGITCTLDASYECAQTPAGSCNCTKQSEIGSCTDWDPDLTR